jgi:hypothetical protein
MMNWPHHGELHRRSGWPKRMSTVESCKRRSGDPNGRRGSIVAPEGMMVFNHSHQLEFADESSKIILILQLLELDTLFLFKSWHFFRKRG